MAPSRREFLTTTGAVVTGGTVAGSGVAVLATSSGQGPGETQPLEIDASVEQDDADAEPVPQVAGTWPMYKFDPANTGYTPETTGPRREVKQAWRGEIEDGGIYCTPAVVDGTVFVGTYRHVPGTGRIIAFDGATGERQWVVSTETRIRSSPAVVDGTLYINTEGHRGPALVYAVNVASGEVDWTHELADFEPVRSSPAVEGGVVYVSGPRGDAVVVRALDATSGEEQWSFTIEPASPTYSSPTVANGTVYYCAENEGARTGGGNLVVALDAATGAEEWWVRTCRATGSPTVVDNTMYHSTTNASLVARDTDGGEKVWKRNVGIEARYGPAATDEAVYVTTKAPGTVAALTPDSGEVLWEFDTGETRGSPVVDSDTVYVPSWGERRVYAVDAGEGTERWTFDFDFSPAQPPAVVDGTIFAGSAGQGNLYSLTER